MNDFMDGVLDADQAVMMTGHLRTCETCRREWEALEATRNLLRASRVPEGQSSQKRVMARFRQRTAEETFVHAPFGRRSWWRIKAIPLSLATAGAALGVAGLLFLSQPAPVPPADAWPSRAEVNRMLTLHAIHSAYLSAGAPELHHYILDEANSTTDDDGFEGEM
jgi:anti-sigma factor RsiW